MSRKINQFTLEQSNISKQISRAMKARKKKTADLAKTLGVSQRQIQNLLNSGRWNAKQIEKLSEDLDWPFLFDPYGRSEVPSDLVKEDQMPYSSKLSFSINLSKETAKELPGLVEELEEIIRKRIILKNQD